MIFHKKNPLKITETVLRDAHQSLMATRMKTEDMLPIIETMDEAGYDSVECWGGATFDVCMRYLGENPWERLRTLRSGFKRRNSRCFSGARISWAIVITPTMW